MESCLQSHVALWSGDLARSHDKIKLPYHLPFGSMVTYLDGLAPIKFHHSLITWSCKVTWQAKVIYIFTAAVPMAIKHGKMVTYIDGLLPIKLHGPSFTWFSGITWQRKIIIFLLPQCLWPPVLTSWSGDLPWRASTNDLTPPLSHVVLGDHATN